jgi:heme exporter protein C
MCVGNRKSCNLLIGYWALTLVLFAAALVRVIWFTPEELTMGPVQKIFYLHLPVAVCTFLGCLVSFTASIGYLVQRKTAWDDLAAAGARVAVQLCTVVLATGMIWGRSAWGQWWTWSPRLTFSLVLWLLYVVYLALRMSFPSGQRRAVISAIYGIIAFLDVPLVYLSARMMPDIHPSAVELAPAMRLTLAIWFPPVVLLTAGLIYGKFTINRAHRLEATTDDEPDTAAPPLHWVGGAL